MISDDFHKIELEKRSRVCSAAGRKTLKIEMNLIKFASDGTRSR
jgi:hypothetical protein